MVSCGKRGDFSSTWQARKIKCLLECGEITSWAVEIRASQEQFYSKAVVLSSCVPCCVSAPPAPPPSVLGSDLVEQQGIWAKLTLKMSPSWKFPILENVLGISQVENLFWVPFCFSCCCWCVPELACPSPPFLVTASSPRWPSSWLLLGIYWFIPQHLPIRRTSLPSPTHPSRQAPNWRSSLKVPFWLSPGQPVFGNEREEGSRLPSEREVSSRWTHSRNRPNLVLTEPRHGFKLRKKKKRGKCCE